jgi:hypothetical protein
MDLAPPIVAHAPCAWDSASFESARARLTRIAQQRPVVVLEPAHRVEMPRARWELARPARGLLCARAHVPQSVSGFDGDPAPRLVHWVKGLLAWRGVDAHVAWLYEAEALSRAQALAPEAIVYDRIDGPRDAGADPDPLLLRAATLVFTQACERTAQPTSPAAMLGELDRALRRMRGARARRRATPVASPALRRASA